MTKEELITIVNEAIEAKLTAINQKTTEEVVVNQEVKKGTCNEKATCETPDENATEVATTEEKTEVAEEVEEEKKEATEEKTEVEDATEVAKTTEVEDEDEDEDEDETTEVVKEEVLNTAPATTVPVVEEEWKKLNGEDFRKWCAEHAQFCNSYKG